MQEPLKLEGAILPMAKPRAKPGILIPLRLNVGDPIAVALYEHRLVDARDLQRARGHREPAAQQQSKDEPGDVHRNIPIAGLNRRRGITRAPWRRILPNGMLWPLSKQFLLSLNLRIGYHKQANSAIVPQAHYRAVLTECV